MGKLRILSGREVCAILARHGFLEARPLFPCDLKSYSVYNRRDGRFRIEAVPVGPYEITVTATWLGPTLEYIKDTRRVTISIGNETQQEVRMAK